MPPAPGCMSLKRTCTRVNARIACPRRSAASRTNRHMCPETDTWVLPNGDHPCSCLSKSWPTQASPAPDLRANTSPRTPRTPRRTPRTRAPPGGRSLEYPPARAPRPRACPSRSACALKAFYGVVKQLGQTDGRSSLVRPRPRPLLARGLARSGTPSLPRAGDPGRRSRRPRSPVRPLRPTQRVREEGGSLWVPLRPLCPVHAGAGVSGLRPSRGLAYRLPSWPGEGGGCQHSPPISRPGPSRCRGMRTWGRLGALDSPRSGLPIPRADLVEDNPSIPRPLRPLPAQWEPGSQLLPTPPWAAASRKSGRGPGAGRGCLSAPGILPSAPPPAPSPQVSVVEVSGPPPGFLQQPLPGLFHRPLAWSTRMGGPQRPLLAPPKPGSPSTLSPTVALAFCRARRWRGSQRLLCGRLQSSLQTKAHPHLQGGVLRACQTTSVRALSSWLVPCRPLSVPETPNPLGCGS